METAAAVLDVDTHVDEVVKELISDVKTLEKAVKKP
jgi:hypothetical protein